MDVTTRRERKKLDTRRALIQAARELVGAHGVDGVTIEQIADAAGYTSRTFFNHFSCKEEAVVAYDPITLTQLTSAVHDRPADENPVETLRAVLVTGDGTEVMVDRWLMRHELVARHPRLLPWHLAAMELVESVLTDALAERGGVDPADEPRVRMIVAAVLAATRAAVRWWIESDRARPLLSVLDEVFDLISPTRLTTA